MVGFDCCKLFALGRRCSWKDLEWKEEGLRVFVRIFWYRNYRLVILGTILPLRSSLGEDTNTKLMYYEWLLKDTSLLSVYGSGGFQNGVEFVRLNFVRADSHKPMQFLRITCDLCVIRSAATYQCKVLQLS